MYSKVFIGNQNILVLRTKSGRVLLISSPRDFSVSHGGYVMNLRETQFFSPFAGKGIFLFVGADVRDGPRDVYSAVHDGIFKR
jgi:hypothetical protein